ncbi:hypothetical protein HAZT_HAZT006792 [Hyalella azteca]|uniref:Ig-like domain-containing protein n=1 Tax=Hyalella azteca TaxID=294128 RepID=A0A6A0H1W8_HYAAZ|nr:hypothetical protein HAZT_HAZT006792 [Hyalella azteca]
MGERFQNDGLGSPTGPRFDQTIPRNLTVQEGQTAILSCRVLNLAEKTYKYSTDQRVSVVHNEASQEWVLRIRAAEKDDAGKYECQISTKPVLSYIVNVNVIEPRAEIVNAPDIYVHQGSLINLTCLVHHGTDRPIFVYWYHGNKLMEYEGDREGVTVVTEATKNTVSYLLVHNASFADTGRYTCKPSNGNSVTANLHVLEGT